MKDILEEVNAKILKALESGTAPWAPGWVRTLDARDRNAFSNRPYSGINAIILSLSGYADPRWMTYKQAQEHGGQVRKGEHGTAIVFWSTFIPKDKTNDPNAKKVMFLKSFTVFNAQQVDGLTLPELSKDSQPTPVNDLMATYQNCPKVLVDGKDPCYNPATDTVHLPFQWVDEAHRVSTTYHELVHSTGHKTRLDRDMTGTFGSKSYAREELVAELGSAYCASWSGRPWHVESTASYLKSWSKRLGEDPMLFVWASSRAFKSAQIILSIDDTDDTED